MAKFAEKLTILQEFSEHLLDRMHFAKKTLGARSVLQNEKLAKITQAISRTFPELPPNVEKISGYEVLKARADEVSEELRGPYETFLDALDFKEQSLGLLKDIAESTVALKFEENAELLLAFMNLVVAYCQVHLLLGGIADAKVLIVVYSLVFRIKENHQENNFSRLSTYLTEYDVPIRRMQEEMSSLSSRVGETLMHLVMTYNKCNSTAILRKEGALSLTLHPDRLTLPIQDHFRFELVYMGRFYMWIIYGFLFCPAAITPDSMELLKAALSDGWIAPIYRDEVMYVHAEFEALFAWYQNAQFKLAKHKKMIAEAATAAVQGSGPHHRERRIYLRQEMHQLLNLLTDRPGLLGPKIQLVFAALSLANDEVMWYFRHLDRQPPKAKGKFNEAAYKDGQLSDLIYLMEKLGELVLKHKRVIQMYYVEYLSGPDYDRVNEAVTIAEKNHKFDVGAIKILKAVVDGLKEHPVSDLEQGKAIDLEPLRLNWLRVVCVFSSIQSSVRISSLKDLVGKAQLAVTHSRNVDQLELTLKEFQSLHELYYFKEQFLSVFKANLNGSYLQPYHSVTLLNIMTSFPMNASRGVPQQRVKIGQAVVTETESFLNLICSKIIGLIEAVAGSKGFQQLSNQVLPVYAAHILHHKQSKSQQGPSLAGSESRAAMRRTPMIQTLRHWETNLQYLCASLKDAKTMVVCDTEFTPVEFLKEKLTNSFRQYLLKAAKPEGEHIQRPVVLEMLLQNYVAALKLVERSAGIDVITIVRKVLLEVIVDKGLAGATGELDSLKEAHLEGEAQPLIHHIATWYADFVCKKLSASNCSGVVFSPFRKSFLSKPNVQFRAEEWADMNEFNALARLVGPYGIRVIDARILRFLSKVVGKLKKDCLEVNRDALEAFRKHFPKEPGTTDALKKMKNIESLSHMCVTIGLALNFRQLMRQGLQSCVSDTIPYVYKVVADLTSQYPSNMFGNQQLIPLDCLALDCGLPQVSADPALRQVLLQHNSGANDAERWGLLPYLFALLFSSPVTWKDASYRTSLEAHSNNAHCLTLCMHQLLIALQGISLAQDQDGRNKLAEAEKTFIETASLLLIRMKADTHQKHAELPPMFIFMDKFINTTELLTYNILTDNFPYALLRSTYLYLYETQRKRMGGEDEGEAF